MDDSPHEGVPPALPAGGGSSVAGSVQAADGPVDPKYTNKARDVDQLDHGRLVRENTSFETKKRNPAVCRQACPLELYAREFVRTLAIHPAYFDEQFDCCFCERCYPLALPDTIANEGPTEYVVPRGWYRVGLALPPRAKALDIFRQWSASFHGTKDALVLKSVLETGTLMKPGDRLLNGTILRSTKCAGRQANVMYTSPTIEYAGMKFYAQPQLFVPSPTLHSEAEPQPECDMGHAPKRMAASIVLQIRQKPGSFKTQGETMGFEKPTKSGKGPWPGYLAKACPHVDLETIEWKTETTAAAIPYGILIRVFDPDDDSETSEKGNYSSPVGKSKPQPRQRTLSAATCPQDLEPRLSLKVQPPLPKEEWPEELKQHCLHRASSELTGKRAKIAADELREGSPPEALAMYVHAWNTGYQSAALFNQMSSCFGPDRLSNDDLAILLLSEAIDFGTGRHPDAFIWFNNRRRARTRAGDFEGALEDAAAVLQLAPDNERGDMHAASAREALLDLEGHPVSKFYAPELRGRTAFDLGNQLKNEDKNYAAALGMFLLARETAWVAGDPAPAVCYNQMAVCYSRLNDDHRAIEMYEAALHEEPGHRDNYIWLNNVRRVYQRMGDQVNADRCARKGLEVCPMHEKGRAKRKDFILSLIESEGHPHDELAKQTLGDLARLSGQDALRRGLKLREASDLTDAIAMFVLALETGADMAACYDWIGQCYSQAGGSEAPADEADRCFKRAIDMFDLAILHSEMVSRFVYYDHRRMAKAKAGDATGALEDAATALDMCPETDGGRHVAEQLRSFMSQGQGDRQMTGDGTAAEGERSLARGLSRTVSRQCSGVSSPPHMPPSSDEEYDGESD